MNNNDNVGNNLVNPEEEKSTDLVTEENINNIDFNNPVHEFNNLQPIPEPQYKKRTMVGIIILVAVILILIIYLIINSIIKSSQNKVCIPIEEKVLSSSLEYATDENLLPINEGESVTIDIEDLYSEEFLKKSEIMIKDNACDGNVKITKYKDEYIKTLNLTSCGYCTTDKRYKKWSKEVSNKPNGKNMIVDVTAYYNYSTYEDYNSTWTSYLNEDLISDEVSEKYGVAIPIEQKYLPTIPTDAKILKIEKEDKNYYRFRDKKWRYYVDRGGAYTATFYSEAPQGYPNRDDNTAKLSDWSEWSLNYPEVKNYRTIKSATGYKWYYLEGKTKKYWNGGAYSVDQPSDKYNKKDQDNSAIMYRYQDRVWLWYNGNKRIYSGFSSVAPKGYTIRDNEFVQYTNWSQWHDVSYLNNNNSNYREQEIKVYSRYRIQYRINSYSKLENYLTLKEFEKKMNTTLSEFLEKDKTSVDVIYKFKYRKR